MPSSPTRADIYLCDDQMYAAQSLAFYLDTDPKIQYRARVVPRAEDVPEEIAQSQRHPIAVLDYTYDDGPSGIRVARNIWDRRPEADVILLTEKEDPVRISWALDEGVSAYLSRTASLEEIEAAVAAVTRGEVYVEESLLDKLGAAAGIDRLTKRQREWATLFLEGQAPGDIADALGVDRGSVYQMKYRVKNLFDVDSTAALKDALSAYFHGAKARSENLKKAA